MAKKKKTLKVAVLASVFAMTFSTAAWATENYNASNNGPTTTNTNYFDTKIGIGTYYFHGADYDITNSDKRGFHANPTLQGQGGIGDGVADAASRAYGYDYNYYLQWGEYYDQGDYWDRITGVKLIEGNSATNGKWEVALSGNEKVTVTAVQLHHVLFDKETGKAVAADGTNIDSVFLHDTADSNKNHYCGESAQSVTIGQLQRINEINYMNFESIANGIKANDTRIDTLEVGWKYQVNDGNEVNIHAGDVQKFIDGNNIDITTNGDGNIIVSTASDVTFNSVKIGDTTITNNNEGDLTYSYQEGNKVINKTIATTDDGMKYGADSGSELDLKLNEKLNVKGGSNINTIASVVDGIAQIEVNLDENIVVNSVDTQVLYSNNIYSDAATITTIYTDNVYAGAIDTKILYADKIDADEAEIDTLHSKNIYSDSVSTKVLYSDNIYSDAGTIDNLYSNYVDSNVVSTNTLTLKGNSQNTDVTFNDAADGNDGARGRIEYKDSSGVSQQVANLNDGKTFAGDSGSAFVKLQDGVNIIGGANVKNLSEGNIGVIAEANNDGSATLNVKLAKDIAGLNSVESNIVNVNNTLTVGDTNTNITVTKDTININNKTQITENGININNKVIVEENKVDVGGNRIENVADGVNPTDAVNVRQLDKLGNRVDKVGAGAAALAALHPLDFDPDDKLSFSAGVGNYGGETASALGMFYRPTEKVMLSAAGTMGNGENMVNMGVTFALDRKNNVSNSRVAMAREIQDLREQVAALTALVTQLAGRNNPVLMDTVMFPDVPENHWAYDYIEGLQKRGIVEGYPDGNFGGDRSMTRYEYAAMLYRALEKGFPVDSRLLDEFDAELGRIRIDRIKGLDDDGNKIERVRVNQYEDRDDYGSKLTTVNEAE